MEKEDQNTAGEVKKVKFRQFRSKLKKTKDGVNLEPKLTNVRSFPQAVHDTTSAGDPGANSHAKV
jgi:hypothetical protein